MMNPYQIPSHVSTPTGVSRGVKFVSGEYGSFDNFFRSVTKDTWVGQAFMSNRVMAEVINEMGPIQDDDEYNPIQDEMNQNYLSFPDIVESRSASESAYLRKMIDENQQLSLELDVGGAGVSRFMSQLVDPLTYTPVPIVKGIGFVKGMVKSAPAVGASVAASEYLRQSYDPTVTKEEMAFSVGAGALMGSAIGGIAGAWGKKGRHASLKEAGDAYDNLIGRSEKPVAESVVRTESEILANAQKFFDDSGIEFVVTNTGGKLAGTSRDGSRVSVDTKSIRDDFAEGMGYVLGKKESKYSKQKKVVFETVDVAKLKQWFDDNGGADKYIEFIIEHEKAHIRLGHVQKYPKDFMSETAINMEREANEAAFRAIGLDPLRVRRLKVPENLQKDLDAATGRLSQRQAEVDQLKGKAKELKKEAAVLREAAASYPDNKGGRVAKKIKMAESLEAQAKQMSERASSAEEYMRGMRDDVDSINTRIEEVNASDDYELYELAATGVGLEKIKTSQLPWYRLINNNLRKLVPEIAADWMRLAHGIAGSPSLMTKGAAIGEAPPVSVEMLAKQWDYQYRHAVDENNKIYLRYLEKAADPSRRQAVVERGRQYLGGKTPEGKLSALEFRQAVSTAMMNGDKVDDPFVAEAVAVWRPIFDAFEKAGKETGVFKTLEAAKREVARVEGWLEELRDAEMRAAPHVEARKAHKERLAADAKAHGKKLRHDDYVKIFNETNWEEFTLGSLFGHRESLLKYKEKLDADIDELLSKAARNNNEDKHLKGLYKVRESVISQEKKLHSIYEAKKEAGAPIGSVAKAEERLIAAQERVDQLMAGDFKTESFFHRMIRQDKLEDPKIRSRLEEVLTKHFTENSERYVGSQKVKYSTDPEHIEARVRETIVEMHREASFNDSLGLIDKGNKAERYQKRMDSLKEQMRTASDKEKRVLEHQIQIIQNKLEKGVGHGKGGPSPVLTRKLDIPTKDIAFILEDDIEMVMQHYVLKMGPVVEMARKFGDFRLDGEIARLSAKLDEAIKANPKIAEELKAEKKALIQATEDLRDKVLGTFGIPNNPDALHNRAIRTLKAWNVLTLMGKAWMAALADSGKIVMSEGFGRTFGNLFQAATEGVEKGRNSEWFISGKEVEMAGEALDVAMATRMNQMTEMGGSYHGMTKLERWMQQQQGPFFFVNLLSVWTDNAKRFAGSLIQSRMIEDAVLWSNGKLPADRIERLASIGMSEQWAKRFARQWKESGEQKGDHLFLANTTEWTDQEAVTFFRAMLATEVDNAVITPGAADKFNFMGKPFGSMLMQYRGFGLSATQRILMSGLQRKDMSTLAGALSMVGIAFIVDYARRPDYAEMDMKDMLFRAVEKSGIAGIFSDINGAIEVASGGNLGLRPMMGIDQIVTDPNWAQRTGAVAGPVANQWLQLVHAISDPSATESEQARAIRYMIPYNNLWFWSDTFTRAQRTLQEQLEE